MISTSSPAPVAFTVTMPPPAEASATWCGSLLLRLRHLLLHLLRLLHQRVHVEVHASSSSVASKVSLSSEITSSSDSGSSAAAGRVRRCRSQRGRHGQPLAGDGVERLTQQREVLRILDLTSVEVGAGSELERQRLSVQPDRPCLAEQCGDRDRLLADGGDDRALPRVLKLLELRGPVLPWRTPRGR